MFGAKVETHEHACPGHGTAAAVYLPAFNVLRAASSCPAEPSF